MQTPKLIAFDLDGTLAESKQPVSETVGTLLHDLLAVVPVAILSGASFAQFQEQLFPALPADTNLEHLYLFPANAGRCFVYRGAWQPHYDYALTLEEKRKIMVELHTALSAVGLAEEPTELWGERVEDRDAQISFSPLGQHAPIDAKEAWHTAHDTLRQELRRTLAQALPGFSVVAGGLTTIDITRQGITKAYGVQRLSDITNIPIADMLYMGDALQEGGNDAVVLSTGIQTQPVTDPDETSSYIKKFIHQAAS